MSGPYEPVAVRAHAKLNVFLRVLGRRPDGFHDLESLVLPLELHDLVTVSRADDLTLRVRGERAHHVPTDEGNLVMRAARALADAAGIAAPGATIEIDKRIPVAAGMGGGSADAAAALRCLDDLWSCGLTGDALAEVGARVGSDVPALMSGGPVHVGGRGERVDPVHLQGSIWVVKPFPFQVVTPRAFAWWDEDGTTGPDPGALIAAAETGNTSLLGSALFNDLQGPVAARHPVIAATIEAFTEAGAAGAVMTGSGPTVVALAAHLGEAERLASAVPGSIVTAGPPSVAPRAG
jgi:4-diphosphocytidyl-2-C-methyl-D-erythritol kinase